MPAGAEEEAEQQAAEAEQQALEAELQALEAELQRTGASAAASSPTRVCLLQGGMLWLEKEVEGGTPAAGPAAPAASDSEPSRRCSDVGSVCRDSWLEEERGQEGSRPVAVDEVRSEEEWRLPLP